VPLADTVQRIYTDINSSFVFDPEQEISLQTGYPQGEKSSRIPRPNSTKWTLQRAKKRPDLSF
jgi:hypothetical protein